MKSLAKPGTKYTIRKLFLSKADDMFDYETRGKILTFNPTINKQMTVDDFLQKQLSKRQYIKLLVSTGDNAVVPVIMDSISGILG